MWNEERIPRQTFAPTEKNGGVAIIMCGCAVIAGTGDLIKV